MTPVQGLSLRTNKPTGADVVVKFLGLRKRSKGVLFLAGVEENDSFAIPPQVSDPVEYLHITTNSGICLVG